MSPGARVEAVGVLTGWGRGVAAWPADARAAARPRQVVTLPRPALDGERFRRATRECLLGVAAVDAMLADGRLPREAIRGPGTALLFVTAAAYGASNVAFIGGERPTAPEPGSAAGRQAGTLHFPYTAPSALAAEVAIEFGLTGAYVILIGGGTATVDALWQAGRWLATGRCQRALVLAVETFDECQALWQRARWRLATPLVEAAACALLAAGESAPTYHATALAGELEGAVETRAGHTLACGPLLALALSRAGGGGTTRLSGTWRGRTTAIDIVAAGAPIGA